MRWMCQTLALSSTNFISNSPYDATHACQWVSGNGPARYPGKLLPALWLGMCWPACADYVSAVAFSTPHVWAASPAVAPGRLGRSGAGVPHICHGLFWHGSTPESAII